MEIGRFRHPEGAELQPDLSAADWIRPRLLLWGLDVGTRCCAVVPTGYEVYLRIFHHVKDELAGEPIKLRWSEVAQQAGRRMHPAIQFERLSWPHRPDEGTLSREEAMALVGVLRDQTATPESCWFAIWHGYGELSGGVAPLRWQRLRWPRWQTSRLRSWFDRWKRSPGPPPEFAEAKTLSLPGREYYLYRGSIDVVPRFEFLPAHVQTPNMWWPQDRAWFVGTEIDFDSTLVACKRRCADALLACDLEVLEVSPEARLDLEGDTVNPPR